MPEPTTTKLPEYAEAPPWRSALTEVATGVIRVRGYDVDALAGRVSFAGSAYLILRGELPTPAEERLLDAALVACIDHGATPPSTLAARTCASTGAPLGAAIAAGILSVNAHHGGAIEGAMRAILAVQRRVAEGDMVADAARAVMESERAAGRRLPGFGHRIHPEDPRSVRLLALARESGLDGDAFATLHALGDTLEEQLGRSLPVNVDGAVAAILCVMGFDPALANAFFLMARLPGLVAHVVEEQQRERPVRRIHPSRHTYDGPPARRLPETEAAN